VSAPKPYVDPPRLREAGPWASITGLWLIVRRSLRQHAVSTAITVLSVALAIGLTMAVFALSAQTRTAFTGGKIGFDAVVGARGSDLQLVLNTVFHLETSPGNLPWKVYEELKANPAVSLAVPYAVGDNYRGFRIVGTTDEIFTKFEYREGVKLTPRAPGRVFSPAHREAVIGATVAERTGLGIGSRFNPSHGVESDHEKHKEEYVVVGVLETTNSPSDRVLWIPIEGVFRLGGHVLRGTGEVYTPKPGEPIPDEAKEVSAVMLRLKSPLLGMQLKQTINNQGKTATMAFPIAQVMTELFDKLGWVSKILAMTAYLVVLVAAASIVASLYNTMNERRREFAILRALGARRGTVFAAIVLESTVIAGLGSLAGFLVYGAILAGAAVVVKQQTGVELDVFAFEGALVATPLAMTALGAISGILPATKAYRTEVAENLSPTS
jgi:putative ABC transport system permease protein